MQFVVGIQNDVKNVKYTNYEVTTKCLAINKKKVFFHLFTTRYLETSKTCIFQYLTRGQLVCCVMF